MSRGYSTIGSTTLVRPLTSPRVFRAGFTRDLRDQICCGEFANIEDIGGEQIKLTEQSVAALQGVADRMSVFQIP